MLTRTINGVQFEIDAPGHLRPVGLPVEIQYMGDHWRVTLLWRDRFTSGEYPTREAAIAVVANGIGAH